MKKIYSLAFFRHAASAYESPRCGASQGNFFANFLPVVVRAFRSIFLPQGWTLRIHHDDTVRKFPYFNALAQMNLRGILELEDMGKAETLCGSMLWRMKPAMVYPEGTPGGHLVAARDLDSLPTCRELQAINRWLAAGAGEQPVLALHDSVSHTGTALMGGMIAVRSDHTSVMTWLGTTYTGLLRLQKESGIDFNRHGSDQEFLNRLPCRPIVYHESRESLGPRTDPRDLLSAHIGGAFHALPAQQWYDANLPDAELLAIEKEVGL